MSYAITKRSSSASHDLSHTLILVIPISLWEAPENLSHWPSWWVSCLDQRLVAVLGQHWEESRLCSIYLTGLLDILHIHIFLFAPLCVCRQDFFHISQQIFAVYFLDGLNSPLRGWLVTGPDSSGKWFQHQFLSELKMHLDNSLNHMA